MGLTASSPNGDTCICAEGSKEHAPTELVHAEPSIAEVSKQYSGIACRADTEQPAPLAQEGSQTFLQWSRLTDMRQLEVDLDVVRAIPFHESLRDFGRLWRISPLDMDLGRRSQLWNRSTPASSFDVFLSHTWKASGTKKFLALLLQSGWPAILLGWAASITLAWVLCLLDILPMPFEFSPVLYTSVVPPSDFKDKCPLGPWVMLFGVLGSVIGFYVSPYLPRQRTTLCFLDAVSIHQTDPEMLERGVYGLGGFLSISRELRVLWTVPHLSRLWCVFELAAYRKANPTGRITLLPVFIEISALCLWCSLVLVVLLLWASLASDLFREFIFVSWFLSIIPFGLATHLLRRSQHQKHQLISDLESFDMSKAKCRKDFDREYVHAAVRAWYGSEQSFTEYVRGPLRQELLRSSSHTSLPLPYYLLLATVCLNGSLEELLGLYKANMPGRHLLAHVTGHTLGVTMWFVLGMFLMFYLCDRLAAPRRHLLLDCGLSVLILATVSVFLQLAGSLAMYSIYSGTVTSSLFLLASFTPLLVLFCRSRTRTAAWSRR